MNNMELIPFGKYKGQPLEAIKHDKQYLDWLSTQDWFREKYANVYQQIIVNNFTEPADTPEHNKMQAKFLNEDYSLNILVSKERINDLNIEFIRSEFETKEGWDVNVVLDYDYVSQVCKPHSYEIIEGKTEITRRTARYDIEIKPVIGDDWPSILRDLKHRKTSGQRVIIYANYSGVGCPEHEMVKIFETSNYRVIKV
jgi:hypothetical protein